MLESFPMLESTETKSLMREDTHPQYYKVNAVCVCGNTLETGSTMPEIRLDVCSACHPFYTGTKRLMDTEGRVEKFKKRYAKQAGK
jgi:large subunit ribosomal protein L31